MNHDTYSPDYLRRLFADTRTIAIVGISKNMARPSNGVAAYLQAAGYRIIPINPGLAGQEIFGETVYAHLADVPEPIDMIDVFRRQDALGALVDEALALPTLPKVIWMQLDLRDDAAAARAEAAGVAVVMDRCTHVEHARLMRR